MFIRLLRNRSNSETTNYKKSYMIDSNFRLPLYTFIIVVFYLASVNICELNAQSKCDINLLVIDRLDLSNDISASHLDGDENRNDDKAISDSLKSKDEVEADSLQDFDVEPYLDMKKLAGLVEYPEIARKAEIQGTVIVRVLVDKSGKVTRMIVEHADNLILIEAAINAVKKYGNITPAILNGKPITCWVSIPIRFRLR